MQPNTVHSLSLHTVQYLKFVFGVRARLAVCSSFSPCDVILTFLRTSSSQTAPHHRIGSRLSVTRFGIAYFMAVTTHRLQNRCTASNAPFHFISHIDASYYCNLCSCTSANDVVFAFATECANAKRARNPVMSQRTPAQVLFGLCPRLSLSCFRQRRPQVVALERGYQVGLDHVDTTQRRTPND